MSNSHMPTRKENADIAECETHLNVVVNQVGHHGLGGWLSHSDVQLRHLHPTLIMSHAPFWHAARSGFKTGQATTCKFPPPPFFHPAPLCRWALSGTHHELVDTRNREIGRVIWQRA